MLLHSSNDLYGASKIFLQLIDLLTKNGFDVHIIIPEKGMLDNFLIKKNIKIVYVELGVLRKKYLNPLGLINRLVANIKAIAFLSNYIKDHSIDLVYTNTSTILCGGIAAKKNGVPSIFHIHEIPTGNKLYEFLSGNKASSREIITLFRKQDEIALLVMNDYFERVAKSFSTFINILDPEIIICGGGMSDIDELYDEIPNRVVKYLASNFFLTPIVKAIHGNSSGVRGAAFLWD